MTEHRESVRRHALSRLWERFGIEITDDEYDRISAYVGTRLRCPDGFSAKGKPVFRVEIDGVEAYAGWHDDVFAVGTFHPGESCRLNRKKS